MDLKNGTRRELLIGAGASGAALLLTVHPATATTESMDAAIKTILGGAKAKEGKVQLDIPPLVENGNTVAMTVTVDSPMTATDYVKAIHIFNERNPQPYVASFFWGHAPARPTYPRASAYRIRKTSRPSHT